MRILGSVIAVFILISLGQAQLHPVQAKGTPMEEIRSTIDAILETLRDKELSLAVNRAKRRQRILSLIRDRFDFEEMAKRSLARHWRKRTPEERKEFVSIFSRLLEASYISKIEAYTNEKITYDREVIKGGGRYAVVSTSVITKDVTIPIDYKVMQKGDRWWVYDVSIEGVSFISTYRSQYNKIIMKESYEGLLKRMKRKLDEVRTLEKDGGA